MRKYALLLMLWVGTLARATAQASAEAPAPFRRANTVRLYTPDEPTTVLRALATNLQQRGYTLDSAACEHGLVTTRPTIPAGTESWPLVVRLSRITGGIELTGTFTATAVMLAGAVAYPSEFWGFEWSPAKKTFREIEVTARSYPAGQVRYSRQSRAAGKVFSSE